jgi:protein-disulfide isomerase
MDKDYFGRVLSVVAVSCAVVMTVLVARRNVGFSAGVGDIELNQDSSRVEGWPRYHRGGEIIAGAGGRVKLVVFTDFQCPACRRFMEGPVRGARDRFGSDLEVAVQQWPLSSHRLARPTAEAAMCAAAQGAFEAFHDLVFEKQDSIGLKPFSSFAEEAGVPDLSGFDSCVLERRYSHVIDSSIVMVSELGGRGTPLIMINDLVLRRGLDSLGLDRIIADELGRSEAALVKE